MNNQEKQSKKTLRAPVVVIMGHVDHGKSTLLDYIRKTNIVDGEAGGITQHISAYEVKHKDEAQNERKITFLDTPGHEAFSKMRARGARTADVAILVVSAEDGVKAQTTEAWETIINSKIPFIVAINKIDKPNANIDKTKNDLLEKGIYLEGLGGDISYVPISAKTGAGVNDLLDMILLVSDLEEFTGNKDTNAEGIIIESHMDSKRGISATGIIKNGTIKSGMFVVAENSIVSTKMMENFLGKSVKELSFSSPIKLAGFDNVPEAGSEFIAFDTKKEAEAYLKDIMSTKKQEFYIEKIDSKATIPLTIKADVSGTIEAILREIEKMNNENISFNIINASVGVIGESDLKQAMISKDSVIVGFNTKVDKNAKDLNETLKIEVSLFDVIYELTDYLKKILEDRRPREEVEEILGTIRILKKFNDMKNKQVAGGKVLTGKISENSIIKILRRDEEIGRGKISGVQQGKIKATEVLEGYECGILLESKIEVATGDVLQAFTTSIK